MQFAHEKLEGLDRERVLSAIAPVLRAHGVEGVELVWHPDRRGWVLQVTVERAGSTEPGAGVTLDLCAEISRDLSTALDVADAIPGRYHLEVGSPGLERALYGVGDYERFSGKLAKLKLREPLGGQHTLRGTLRGLDETGAVLVETDSGLVSVPPGHLGTGQLIFDWRASGRGNGATKGRRRGGHKKASNRSR